MQNLSIELRPANFSQVIGNKEVVSALKAQLESGRIPTCFLFSGPPGYGKSTLAKIIAREIQGSDFIGEPEIIEFNAALTRGIDDIKELVSKTDYISMYGKYRVVIIDEAQQLTDPAQNVLLLPIEKKNSPTVFIFCTTDPGKLLPAIKSRCLSFQLKGLTDTEREQLVNLALDKLHSFEDQNLLLKAMSEVDMVSPRDILNATEKFNNGILANDCVQNIEADIELTKLCSLILSGKWNAVSPLLKNIKPADSKNLRNLLSSFMKNKLFSQPSDILASSLKELALYQTVESGCDLGALIAIIYNYCKKAG